MKTTNTIIIAAFVLIALNGCSEYQLKSKRETAIVDKVSQDTFTVNFCGNAYMNQKEVEKYALQRAAEACLSEGFSHFAVLNKQDDSEICRIDSKKRYGAKAAEEPERSLGSELEQFVRPNISLTVKCFTRLTDMPENAIDARKFLRENFPGLER